MSLNGFSLDDKICLLDDYLFDMRKTGRRYSEEHQILASIAKDLRARRDFPKNNTLGSLEREIASVLASKKVGGYDHGRLVHLGHMVVSRWPTIAQALERYGEESAE